VLCKQDVTLDNWDGIKDKIKAYIIEFSKMKRRERYQHMRKLKLQYSECDDTATKLSIRQN